VIHAESVFATRSLSPQIFECSGSESTTQESIVHIRLIAMYQMSGNRRPSMVSDNDPQCMYLTINRA